MEFTEGQVYAEKLTDYFKRTKEEKSLAEDKQHIFSLITKAKEEIDTITSTINYSDDTCAIEAGIYRLKAAELELNRYLKLAKKLYLT